MAQLNPTQAAQAVILGQLVNVAYGMYDSAKTNPAPPPPSPFTPGFEFVAWVQMKDFIISSTDYMFYGVLARDTSKTNSYVLAIRGTEDLEEWWDDLTSMWLVPMANFGQVGYGFNRIYQTMRVIYGPPTGPGATIAAAAPQSMESAGTFAAQVNAAARRHAAAREGVAAAAPAAAAMSITVAGHSLGSALATLYVADNVQQPQPVSVPLICTFASPRVGDPTFAGKFNGLGIESWRVVNELDVVPYLPYFGFQHVATEYAYNSGSSTFWSLACWHSLDTYLHLVDPKQPLLPSCVWPQPTAAVAAAALRVSATAPLRASMAVAPSPSAEKEIALTAPAGTTINITIKVG